ncbi:ferrochelatase [Blastochloris viridis]|uniref:Ferrochelatase n=1 Tax=Blastochloris viridis TaxID=1079 RepID=A0A0H5BD30_BLAVI|nr:ferrochelatase [Blastochloris viridis]ALK08507.1 Ferrochelatase [Blastochloris viridis]BAR98206.1 ferrochelatase [Blastochloris viridis]CUU41169.1 Ferrochelatase [Blastochloris viridis]
MNMQPSRHDVTAPARLPVDHPSVKFGRIGVLLLNVGTPEGTGYWAMRRYLKEFLTDRRVIEVNRVYWWFVLNTMILPRRPLDKGKAYASIWNTARDESPLKTISRSQAEKLGVDLGGLDHRVMVDWAMRYGHPSIPERVAALKDAGCDRILLVPLYPQYSAATTASACDKAFEALMKMRWQPSIRVVPPYYDDAVYIDAVVEGMKASLAKLSFEPEIILISFHGVPKSYLMKGDPYHCHCAKTKRLIREALGLETERVMFSFQSRFGNEEWLQPYTDETVKALAKRGVKRLAVVAPSFAIDCLETLEELDVENREIFLHNGGEQFAYLPSLNDSEGGIRVIRHLVERELQGWL